jgi:molybdopterin-guanine dinucleotide biosynthesis protein A
MSCNRFDEQDRTVPVDESAKRSGRSERTSMNRGSRNDITGVILVGGKSRRMGQDKAFLQIAGKTLFERVLEVFRESFDRIVLVGNRAERFTGYGSPVLQDIYPGSALGGLYTGLYHSATEYVFVGSCDLPFPNLAVVRHLCSLKSGFDAVVPTLAHGYEPLFALYAKSCLGPMREFLESGNFCAFSYFPRIRVRYVKDEELARLDRDGRSFVNINTPEDLERIRKEGSQ